MEHQGLPRVHPGQPQATAQPRCIRLLVWLDPAAALRMVDIGPPADDAGAAKAFRAFWGNRAELRRFQVGRLCMHCMNRGVGGCNCNPWVDLHHSQVSGCILPGWDNDLPIHDAEATKFVKLSDGTALNKGWRMSSLQRHMMALESMRQVMCQGAA